MYYAFFFSSFHLSLLAMSLHYDVFAFLLFIPLFRTIILSFLDHLHLYQYLANYHLVI